MNNCINTSKGFTTYLSRNEQIKQPIHDHLRKYYPKQCTCTLQYGCPIDQTEVFGIISSQVTPVESVVLGFP